MVFPDLVTYHVHYIVYVPPFCVHPCHMIPHTHTNPSFHSNVYTLIAYHMNVTLMFVVKFYACSTVTYMETSKIPA